MPLSPIETPASARHALLTMWTTRRFEEAVDDLFARGLMHGTMHLSIGQEASATGACMALRDDDAITSTHRGHGHCIGKGADLTRMMAELLAKETGYCRGRGGSMHIADVATGNLGANGIVGGGIPIAAGAALAYQLRGEDHVVACFFGDGATNEGAFHEAVNLAAIWKLPVVFICENNKYGMSFSTEKSMAVDTIAERASAYGIPGVSVDGNDVAAVYDVVHAAVERARAGDGPTLVESVTYRHKGHSKSDKNLYRTREEISEWREQGPDPAVRGRGPRARPALRRGDPGGPHRGHGVDPQRRPHRQRRPRRRPVRPARRRLRTGLRGTQMTETAREITYSEAIREAIGQAMEADDSVFMLGEDIGVYGGAFGVSGDLYHRFGADRIRDTPISELGIVGAAVGAALAGMRPIVEIQFSDFTNQAMDQIVNQAAKIHFMLGGAATVPMVLRAPLGSGTGAAAQHSQSLEAWFAHVPGLKVVMPATAEDAKGLLLSAIDDPNPVIVLEHKLLYRTSGPVPEEAVRVPLGKTAVRRTGSDLTIVATGVMVSRSLEAAEILADQGVDVSVLDPRTLSPLDDAPILEDVARTGRALLVQEAPGHVGYTAEIAARITESPTLYRLLAPIRRLSGLNAPIPYAPQLESASVPQVPDIVDAALTLIKESE